MTVTAKLPESYMEENLALFASLLRRQGLSVGTTEVVDALGALQRIDLSRRDHFKAALQATMIKDRRDHDLFSRVFDHFFATPEEHNNKKKTADHYRRCLAEELKRARSEMQFKGENLGLTDEELHQYSALSYDQRLRLQNFVHKTETGVNVEPQFRPLLETVVKSHLRFFRSRREAKEIAAGNQAGTGDGAGRGSGSSDSSLREIDIEAISSADLPAAEQLLQGLSRKLAVKILRRRRWGPRSGPLDLRRSLRDNMRFGGVIFNLRRRPGRRSRQEVLLLCDVSASMKHYSTFAIHFLHGLQEVVRNLNCFSFSDNLENLTPELRGRAGLQQLLDRVIRRSSNWGGGTDLGSALKGLIEGYPGLIGGRTTLIVVSDTKTILLEQSLRELREIKERVRKVIWLNPLPPERWPDYRSVGAVAALVDMWPCSTIAQLEEVLTGRL